MQAALGKGRTLAKEGASYGQGEVVLFGKDGLGKGWTLPPAMGDGNSPEKPHDCRAHRLALQASWT